MFVSVKWMGWVKTYWTKIDEFYPWAQNVGSKINQISVGRLASLWLLLASKFRARSNHSTCPVEKFNYFLPWIRIYHPKLRIRYSLYEYHPQKRYNGNSVRQYWNRILRPIFLVYFLIFVWRQNLYITQCTGTFKSKFCTINPYLVSVRCERRLW